MWEIAEKITRTDKKHFFPYYFIKIFELEKKIVFQKWNLKFSITFCRLCKLIMKSSFLSKRTGLVGSKVGSKLGRQSGI